MIGTPEAAIDAPSSPSHPFAGSLTLSKSVEQVNTLRVASIQRCNIAKPVSRLPMERIKRNFDESSFRQLALEIDNTNEARLRKTDVASHVAYHLQRGHELLDQGLPAEAEKQFREAVVLDPNQAGAHAGLARVMEANQDKAGARKEAQASLRLSPSAEAYLVLARLDLADNNSAAAAQNVDRALALDPANAAAVALKHDIAAGLAGSSKPQP